MRNYFTVEYGYVCVEIYEDENGNDVDVQGEDNIAREEVERVGQYITRYSMIANGKVKMWV